MNQHLPPHQPQQPAPGAFAAHQAPVAPPPQQPVRHGDARGHQAQQAPVAGAAAAAAAAAATSASDALKQGATMVQRGARAAVDKVTAKGANAAERMAAVAQDVRQGARDTGIPLPRLHPRRWLHERTVAPIMGNLLFLVALAILLFLAYRYVSNLRDRSQQRLTKPATATVGGTRGDAAAAPAAAPSTFEYRANAGSSGSSQKKEL